MVTFQEFSFQSKGIDFAEWVSLLSLCLAPLIAHIASGTPQPSYLVPNRPQWYERLCHYNPASIFWRYASIADRRIRIRSWNAVDMAASNSLFWTHSGWDGSEEIATTSITQAVYLPEKPRTIVLSWTSIKTMITALQGTQALYVLINTFRTEFGDYYSVDMIFFPLSIIGLMRLCAAPWLTEDFAYSHRDDSFIDIHHVSVAKSSYGSKVSIDTERLDECLDKRLDSSILTSTHPSPVLNWRSRVFRAIIMGFVIGLWVLCFLKVVSWEGQGYYTVSSFLMGVFYLIQSTGMLILYSFYFGYKYSKSTIIPCINATWYKIYSGLIVVSMIVLVVVASIETRKNACGGYTILSPKYDMDACKGPVYNTIGI